MRIEIRGRNVDVDDELREHVIKRFRRIGKQVSDLATLDVEIYEERNPSIADSQVAEATLRLKGVTLRAQEASPSMGHTIHELAEDIRRQVKKHREKRRKRTRTQARREQDAGPYRVDRPGAGRAQPRAGHRPRYP